MEKIPAEWGKWISCDTGWDWILEDLHKKLVYLDFNYRVQQVKEKYGTLRFYYQPQIQKGVVQELMQDAVTIAEQRSATTCEICGNSSGMSDSKRGIEWDNTVSLKSQGGAEYGWLKTLCNTCAEPLGYKDFKKDEE